MKIGISEERLDRLFLGFIVFGVGVRLLVYLRRFPIWTDEANLAMSLLDRGFAELLEPLSAGQVAPAFFMWIQKTSTVLFGFSEYSLRIVPLLAAVVSVPLMAHVSRRLSRGLPALFGLALFAVSYYPIRHGAELKPYATDLLASLVLTTLALEWLRNPTRAHRLWVLAAVAPFAVAISFPAIFVAGGICAALAIPVWREGGWSGRLGLAAAGVLSAGTFLVNYLLVMGRQSELASREATLLEFWAAGFPPWNDAVGLLGWFLWAHTGRTFGYPLGSDSGGSILTFLCFVVGAVVLWRLGGRRPLAVLLCPFGFAFVAALLHRYPYGGSGRVSQYMVPAICLLAGLGAARLTSIARQPASRRRAQAGVLVFLGVFGAAMVVVSFMRPYRDSPDFVARDFARWFWHEKAREAELVCAWHDLRLEFARPVRWEPGGADYWVNQRIYFDRVRRGDPANLEAVSIRHPLRVAILRSAVDSHRADFENWLRRMQTRYELVESAEHSFGPFKERRGREDRVHLYTFLPRAS